MSALKKRLTIRDVARKASLSISTVSLVLNDKPNVSDGTRQKVQRTIDELGYHPQRIARGLASKVSGNIGFLLSDDHFSQAEPFYTRIFLGTEFAAREYSYYILLTTASRYFNSSRTVPRFLLERNVDGVIVAGRLNEKLLDYMTHLDLPIVLVDYEFKNRKISSVLIDNRAGILLAVKHLYELGHRAIGFVGGDIGHPSIAERFTAYRDGLQDLHLKFHESMAAIDEPDTGIENGFRAAQKLLAGNAPRPSAIIAANDALAIGCMQFARSINLKVPDELSLVGFDDIEMSSHTDPTLTTIRVFKEEMGKLAIQRLVEMIKSPKPAVVKTYVPVELVARASTGSPAANSRPTRIALSS